MGCFRFRFAWLGFGPLGRIPTCAPYDTSSVLRAGSQQSCLWCLWEVRGFTSLSERLPLAEVAARLNRFHKIAADAMFELDGTFDKAVGDQAMAFFGVPFRPEDHAQRAVTAALWIVKTLEDMIDDDESLRVGGGVGNGEAFIVNVAEGEVRDFTVIGDIVNTAARLQSLAEPGEVVIM